MKRFHARIAVVEALKNSGLYIGRQDYPMQVPICKWVGMNNLSSDSLTMTERKSGDIVETVLKPQWWVSCKPLADVAMKVSSLRGGLHSHMKLTAFYPVAC